MQRRGQRAHRRRRRWLWCRRRRCSCDARVCRGLCIWDRCNIGRGSIGGSGNDAQRGRNISLLLGERGRVARFDLLAPLLCERPWRHVLGRGLPICNTGEGTTGSPSRCKRSGGGLPWRAELTSKKLGSCRGESTGSSRPRGYSTRLGQGGSSKWLGGGGGELRRCRWHGRSSNSRGGRGWLCCSRRPHSRRSCRGPRSRCRDERCRAGNVAARPSTRRIVGVGIDGSRPGGGPRASDSCCSGCDEPSACRSDGRWNWRRVQSSLLALPIRRSRTTTQGTAGKITQRINVLAGRHRLALCQAAELEADTFELDR